MVVCRGCCCGSAGKHPDVDHAARLARLERFAAEHPAAASVRTSECLGPCEHADVVVVRPSPAGRARGGRPVWFGLVDDYALDRLIAWVVAGGPGLAPVPDVLLLHGISRPRSQLTPART
ncbi:(2Fe-2S) ferredoxin domain-containing protein [Planosporangium flavigriseum]|nr:(2Fe-2S) ferredoxin domain-containing protein [Planosporangium flavigriseum]NJC66211.1 (2Fe-2S) ferredoxin domain-containing protein [Planosporangium flavigriseum]